MSIETMSAVLGAKIGDTASKLVLLALANHAHADGTASWPSKALIAEYAECDPKTVQRRLRKLEQAGWIRRGDQELVSHFRNDRRPTVYDVAMTETVRQSWAAEYARQDSVSPRSISTAVDNPTVRQDNESPRATENGGTGETSRGDSAVSPKPSLTTQVPPSPTGKPAGAIETSTNPTGSGCRRHRDQPGANCRACGTTPRLAAKAEAKAEKDRKRQAQLDELRAAQAAAAENRATETKRATAAERLRAAINETRTNDDEREAS